MKVGAFTIGGGGDDKLDHVLDVPAAFSKFDSEPIQQFGMGGPFALGADIVDLGAEGIAEELLPEPIHEHEGGEGILRGGEPAGEIEPVETSAFEIDSGREKTRWRGGDEIAGCVLPVSAREDADGAGLGEGFGDEGDGPAVAAFGDALGEVFEGGVARGVGGGAGEPEGAGGGGVGGDGADEIGPVGARSRGGEGRNGKANVAGNVVFDGDDEGVAFGDRRGGDRRGCVEEPGGGGGLLEIEDGPTGGDAELGKAIEVVGLAMVGIGLPDGEGCGGAGTRLLQSEGGFESSAFRGAAKDVSAFVSVGEKFDADGGEGAFCGLEGDGGFQCGIGL